MYVSFSYDESTCHAFAVEFPLLPCNECEISLSLGGCVESYKCMGGRVVWKEGHRNGHDTHIQVGSVGRPNTCRNRAEDIEEWDK